MPDIVRNYDDLMLARYSILPRTLMDITPQVLAWWPHPEANTTRSILGHHLWYEQWIPNTIHPSGRYLSDRGPLSEIFVLSPLKA